MASEQEVTEAVQVAAMVPASLAKSLREKAQAAERSTAAEIRLALKAWVEAEPLGRTA
jgi:hypothetical protein